MIPTYNEAENLPRLVSALFSLPLDISVLIVDDGSPDGTGRIADGLKEEHAQRIEVIHRSAKFGLRSAYLAGIKQALAAGADVIGQMDADFSHDPAALSGMVERIASCDVVFGSRYAAGGSVDVHWPRWRKALSAFGNGYARTILGISLRDVTTGFRLWRREVLLGMPLQRLQANGYVFLVEMAYLAHCLEYQICEFPIYFSERQHGRSKMSFRIQIEAALRVWTVLWAYRDLRRLGSKGRVWGD